MPGPEETRLIQALDGTHPGKADGGSVEWSNCAELLERVALSLSVAELPIPPGDAGAETAGAITDSFHRSASAMSTRAVKLRAGKSALEQASQAITEANAAHIALGPEPGAPTYTPHEDPNSPAGIKKHNAFLGEMAAYDAQREHREKVARQHADRMDAVFAKSSATMKEIHGIPDPPPPPEGYSGSGGGGAGTHQAPAHHSTTSPSHPGGGTTTTLHPYHPGNGGGHGNGDNTIDYVPGGGGTDDGGSSEGSTSTVPVLGTSDPAPTTGGSTGGVTGSAGLGLAGAAAGGIGGGVLGTGLATSGIRGGGIAPISTGGGTAASGVRGIGATSRSGVSATLGRPGGVSATSSATGTTSRGTGAVAGRGPGSRGASGSRGAAGGRGAASGSTVGGRGGRSKDDKTKGRHGEFDDTDDWIDDEDVAPGVLD